MDCSLPGSSVHGIFQARELEWVAISFSTAVKNSPAMQEMWVRSLGQEDPLNKETETHSSFLAWKIPCTEEPSGVQSVGLQKSQKGLSD